MQDIDRLSKLDCMHRPVGIPLVVINNSQNPCSTKAFKEFSIRMFLPLLGKVESSVIDGADRGQSEGGQGNR